MYRTRTQMDRHSVLIGLQIRTLYSKPVKRKEEMFRPTEQSTVVIIYLR
jgi:hypothetical protein